MMMFFRVWLIGFLWLILYYNMPWKQDELMAMGLMYGLIWAIVEIVKSEK